MQILVNVEQKSIALIFADYLKSININCEIKPALNDNQTLDGWAILCDSQEIDRAKYEFEQFIRQPNHPKYQQSAWQSGQSVKLNGSSGLTKQIKANFLAQAGPFTIGIFILCWLVFAATFLLFGNSLYQLVIFNQAGDISQTAAQPWRLITPALFHYSLLHIAFNTMWWWQLGGQIEKNLGLNKIILLFIGSAVLSNVAQFYMSGPNFGGLSGVVYATVGFVWWYGYLNPDKGIGLSNSIIGFMLFWLVLGYTEFMPINVANTAHLVGLISGVLYALFVTQMTKIKKIN
ncbi:rhomboid family intramembrane serine protease GlpG [Thalassotalea nanhaiensis]|uniref:Rhomboid family intramembrane serine protease GlpG n=1 Tax=Thalassotalea nanhaiensis TaxID=3065648 RepID=A0ABY9TKW9_9GAMM|nr:rhomboid family intramembrane serine protease GlpG [Colwelliaceae bacterium SQ345]